MLDVSYFQNQDSYVQGFFNGGTWQTWVKPRGAKLVNIICQGSGAGGGGGFQSGSTPRSGGAGGGSGATARLTIDAKLLPDVLYILPGIGGIGGLGGNPATTGSSGQNSFVTLIPDTGSISNVVLRSGTTVAVGGTAGTAAANAPGVLGETAGVIGNNIFSNLGTFTFQAGVNSTQGGSSTGQTTTPSNFLVAATGGGGTSVGGNVTATGPFPTTITAATNTNGPNGIILYKPTLILYGGQGGGGSLSSGNGGNGGNGAPGCGGGGGGASFNTGVNAGNGGKGGDGFVIITTSL